ncbi:hypothetical protein [Streptomyces sp. NPDC085529]|uniref:hypothetical protein n=1 Tax=Streptomyces sp. NPDC085529 TaxID=3365729 RepID=UPI0037D8B54B
MTMFWHSEDGEVVAVNPITLRRNSWVAFSWIAILGLGIGMVGAVWNVTSVNGFRMGWQGIPVFFGSAGIIGRVANCKVMVRDGAVIVVNPLRTHHLPVRMIRAVVVGDDGTLEVHLAGDRIVSVFAFGGSLLDRFKGSSEGARRRIDGWLTSCRLESELRVEGSEAVDSQVRWTRCRSADASLALSLTLGAVGALWMVLSGS